MMNCNLAQAGFVIRLTDEYLGDILASRALTRPLAESCLAKLLEVFFFPFHIVRPDNISDSYVLRERNPLGHRVIAEGYSSSMFQFSLTFDLSEQTKAYLSCTPGYFCEPQIVALELHAP